MQNINRDLSQIQHLKATWDSLSISGKGFFVFLLFSIVPSLSVLFMGIFSRIGLGLIAPYANHIFLTISLLFMLPILTKKIRIFDVFLFLIVIVFIIMSPSIWSNSQYFVNENASMFLWTVVPYYFIGVTLDYKKQENIFLSISRLALIIEFFVQLLILFGLTNALGRADDGKTSEQMTAAYGFVFAALYLLLEASHNPRLDNIIMASLAFILLLFMGARGPVVVYMFFFMGFFIIFKRYYWWKKVLIGLSFCVFYIYIDILMLFLLPLAQALGFTTRIFDNIKAGTFVNLDETNGRDYIWESCLDALQVQPNGYGWGGDRYVIVSDWSFFEGYAHNFEIEILVQFGYMLGGIFLFAIFLLLLCAFIKTKGTKTSEFLFLLFCAGIMTLQTSQTYIQQPLLFMLIGYCVSLLRIPKKIII